jgi:Flp pilus assembly protein TadG
MLSAIQLGNGCLSHCRERRAAPISGRSRGREANMQLRNRNARRGASAAELAIVLPLLLFILVIAADFARLYYYSITITSCARQGAINYYDPNNPYFSTLSPYNTPGPVYQQAALADGTNLSPTPVVSTTSGTDAGGNPYVEVTVSGTFSTVTGYPGIPRTVNLSRTVRMRQPPATPK